MLTLFASSFLLIALAVAGMAVGVLCGRRPIAGSCGGLNAMSGEDGCGACSDPCAARAAAERRRADAPAPLVDERVNRPWLGHQTRGARRAIPEG